ncbi:hypothetical protein B0E33_30520 (plasmid) [Roseibium algicola]|uniref:Uncharacterized protein n=1 Tax=Roseibium algicola TaxID=2857014 RepID=A0ABM6IC88_9HYPH|nr:hypothetical protein [Roseibium aggregatum]AQQ08160.1 hypothetical protein B0E33_30520 [Roseibium aggregatum]UES48138.1 hypothetical protein GFK90_29825 [Roseibium aggregatum]
MINQVNTIDGGSAAYWAELREAYQVIASVQFRLDALKTEPQYCGFVDAYGEQEVFENVEPWDRLAAAQEALKANPRALTILEASGRTAAFLDIGF